MTDRRAFLKAAASVAALPVAAPLAGATPSWAFPAAASDAAIWAAGAALAGTAAQMGTPIASGLLVGAHALWSRWNRSLEMKLQWERLWREHRKGVRKRKWGAKSCQRVWAEHRLREIRQQREYERRQSNSLLGASASWGRAPTMHPAYKKLSAKVRAIYPDWKR